MLLPSIDKSASVFFFKKGLRNPLRALFLIKVEHPCCRAVKQPNSPQIACIICDESMGLVSASESEEHRNCDSTTQSTSIDIDSAKRILFYCESTNRAIDIMIQCDALRRVKQQKTSDMLRMLDAAKKSVAEWGRGRAKKIYCLSNTYPTESPRSIHK